MITPEMIEAGARAARHAHLVQSVHPDDPATYMGWDAIPEDTRERWRVAMRAALEAAERAAWRPIEEADPEREYLLYYPEKITGTHKQAKLPARVVVGYPGDSPNRPPTHFRPLPSPPKAPKGKE